MCWAVDVTVESTPQVQHILKPLHEDPTGFKPPVSTDPFRYINLWGGNNIYFGRRLRQYTQIDSTASALWSQNTRYNRQKINAETTQKVDISKVVSKYWSTGSLLHTLQPGSLCPRARRLRPHVRADGSGGVPPGKGSTTGSCDWPTRANHNTIVYQYRSCTQRPCIVPAHYTHYTHSVIRCRPIRAGVRSPTPRTCTTR